MWLGEINSSISLQKKRKTYLIKEVVMLENLNKV